MSLLRPAAKSDRAASQVVKQQVGSIPQNLCGGGSRVNILTILGFFNQITRFIRSVYERAVRFAGETKIALFMGRGALLLIKVFGASDIFRIDAQRVTCAQIRAANIYRFLSINRTGLAKADCSIGIFLTVGHGSIALRRESHAETSRLVCRRTTRLLTNGGCIGLRTGAGVIAGGGCAALTLHRAIPYLCRLTASIHPCAHIKLSAGGMLLLMGDIFRGFEGDVVVSRDRAGFRRVGPPFHDHIVLRIDTHITASRHVTADRLTGGAGGI